MHLPRLNIKPETRKRIFWALIAVAVVLAALGAANLIDYVLHGPKYNLSPIDNPQEKKDLTWGIVYLSIAYKVALVALAISGVSYEIWRWIQVRHRRLARKLAAMRGGGTH